MEQQFSSRLLDRAVGEFAKLPGIGRKTALRLSLHLLKQSTEDVDAFADAISSMKHDVKYCSICHNISDSDICPICADAKRDRTQICVVENIRDVMAIEATMQYNGLYHVLGGIISPLDGIGPADIEIASLIDRVSKGEVKEVIFALSPTVEGETTNFFISRKLNPYNIKLTVIARGVSVGNELEYADEVTLGRSILKRTPFE